jgi:hypothetical protein
METDIPLGLTWWIANFDDCGGKTRNFLCHLLLRIIFF